MHIGLLAAIALSSLLALTANAGVFWLDSGELTASVYTLGVSHPTGFSLFHVIGKAATLIPIGSVAFRLNLLSAVSTGGAAALAAATIFRLQPGAWGLTRFVACAVTAIGLISPTTVWLHSAITEIYALNLLWLALFIHVGSLALDSTDRRHIYGLALIAGLGLGVHITFVAIAGGLFVMLAVHELARKKLSIVNLSYVALFCIIGGAIVLYLPLAAARGPFHLWIDTTTFSGFVDQITARTIRSAFTAEMSSSFHVTKEFGGRHLATVWGQSSGTLCLCVIGLVYLAHRKLWPIFVGVLWVAGFDAYFSISINPMGMRDLQTATPTFLILAIGAGFGATGLLMFTSSRLRNHSTKNQIYGALFSGIFCLLLCAPNLLSDVDNKVQTGRFGMYDVTEQTLIGLPPHATLFVASDSVNSALLYFQGVENRRPDVTHITREFLPSGFYRRELIKRTPRKRLATILAKAGRVAPWWMPGQEPDDLLQRLVGAGLQQGLSYWEFAGHFDGLVFKISEPGFPLARLSLNPTSKKSLQSMLRTVEQLQKKQSSWDRRSRVEIGQIFRYLVPLFLNRRDIASASAAISVALAYNPQDARALLNQGVLADIGRDYQSAARWTRRAVTSDPLLIKGWFNLATYEILNGSTRRAREALTVAAKLAPNHHRYYYGMALLSKAEGKRPAARKWLAKALELAPRSRRYRKLSRRLGE